MSVVQALPFVLCLSVWPSPSAQVALHILHEPIECIAAGQYPVIEAAVPAGTDLRSAKVYFRSDKYPKFYFVDMTRQANALRCVLPRPSAETDRIIYYIEAVDVSFNNTIDAEHTVAVNDQCEKLVPKEDDPGIIVGATQAGAPALPPGFEAAGIIGSLSSAGLLSGLGGGPGIGTAAIIGGAVAGVGGAVVASSGEEEPSGAVGNAPPEPPPPSTGTQPPDPANPQPPELPGPQPPAPPEPPPAPPEPPPAPPEPPEPPPPPPAVTACFVASFPGGSCNMKLDAACSSGTINAYNWVINAPGGLGGVATYSGSKVNHNFPGCAGETVTVKLTVIDGGGASDSNAQTITLPVSLRPAGLQSSLTSSLVIGGPHGISYGSVTLNSARTDRIDDSSPFRHEYEGRPGENAVEAVLVSEVSRESYWKFDFTQAAHFVPGSIRSEMGSVLSVENRQIIFRLSGVARERISIKYRLAR